MDILEVILLIVGIVIFIGSFLLPAGRSDAGRIDTDAAKQEIHGLIEEEMKTVRAQVQDKVEETSEDVVEKAERSLERLTNEKIMAVNEYSDTVLQEYDMLNNKHANIKDTVSKVDKAVKAAEDKVKAIDDTPTVKTEETEKVIPADEPAKTEEAVSPEIGFMGETAEEGQNNNEKILEMHRQGKSTVAIARELGLGVGEVKLVIDLYKA